MHSILFSKFGWSKFSVQENWTWYVKKILVHKIIYIVTQYYFILTRYIKMYQILENIKHYFFIIKLQSIHEKCGLYHTEFHNFAKIKKITLGNLSITTKTTCIYPQLFWSVTFILTLEVKVFFYFNHIYHAEPISFFSALRA